MNDILKLNGHSVRPIKWISIPTPKDAGCLQVEQKFDGQPGRYPAMVIDLQRENDPATLDHILSRISQPVIPKAPKLPKHPITP